AQMAPLPGARLRGLPASRVICPSSQAARPNGTAATPSEEGDADEGSERGRDGRPPPARERHRLTPGAGRHPHRADQHAHGAPEDPPQGSPFASWPAADGGTASATPELPPAHEPGGVPGADPIPGPPPLGGARARGD